MTLPNERKRSSSVSYSRGKDDANDAAADEICISLEPHIHLPCGNQGLGWCGIALPVPFERAAPRSWWNPRFDSEILERQYKKSVFPQLTLQFRYALAYILLVSLSWLVYFVIVGTKNETSSWPTIAIIFSCIGVTMLLALYLTYTDYYSSYVLPTSLTVASVLCLLSLLILVLVPPQNDGLTLVGHFALCSEILLLIYTVIPMPLYACVGICTVYSVLFEFLTSYLYNSSYSGNNYFNDEIITVDSMSNSSVNQQNTISNETILGIIESQNFTSNNDTGVFDNGKSNLLSNLGMAILDGQKVVKKISKSIANSEILQNLNPSSIVVGTINESLTTSREFQAGRTNENHERLVRSLTTRSDHYVDEVDFSTILTIRILMQICIHIIGVHILIMTFVRMRETFMKVGQSLMVRGDLEMEKQLKEKMILSVMPPKVADWLMQESEHEREREDSLKKGSIPSDYGYMRTLFRPFIMHSMENVSILFADIVGFTRMSSNKSAEQLVGILNDLFERFDDLCQYHGCEKIATLGDCYYCVSGCPEPKPDHAKCCVEMGLAMIEAIKQFDNERHEGVNMRVGVHTGNVLCGIVGRKRIKFDVWSNDVTLANKLESTGRPGMVHLSEKTINFLDDEYLMEPGRTIDGVMTYFITGRMSQLLNEFINNVNTPTSISPLMQARHRLPSCNNQFKPKMHYLHMITNTDSYRMRANSLPNILDSDNDEDIDEKKDDANKSPVSTASYGNKKIRNKPWRYLQRQRTTEEMSPFEKDNEKIVVTQEAKVDAPLVTNDESDNGINGIPVKNDIEMDPNPMPSSPLLCGQESLSHASSICSRKDSGIRSNSRRSSLLHQLFLMNSNAQADLLSHRVSGYYTSTSSLHSTKEPLSTVAQYPYPRDTPDTFVECYHKLRKQSDLQLVRCVQDNEKSQSSYFVKPHLNGISLFFKSKEMEKEYRENAHKGNVDNCGKPPTLARSRFNTYFDILVSAIVYSAITASLFLLCEPSPYFIVFCTIATSIQAIVIILCARQLFKPHSRHATFTQNIFKFFSRWYPWHACGAVLVGLPIVSILMNFSCNTFPTGLNHFEYYYSYLIFVGLVHFCNFAQLNCWMKNFLLVFAGVLFSVLVASYVSQHFNEKFLVESSKSVKIDNNTVITIFDDLAKSNRRFRRYIDDLPPPPITVNNHDDDVKPPISEILPISENLPIPNEITNIDEQTTAWPSTTRSTKNNDEKTSSSRTLKSRYNERLCNREIFLDMLLLIILVWFLNREFEISYRLSFHGNAVAARDKARVESMKNQADWLLHNIIPEYVADQLKTTAKYSKNHKNVGIIFASIVNFNELYDESYLGGKEYLRILNELIGDFDDLLDKPEFANVEKMKTIGSTYMAASGLNPQVRQQSEHEYSHLIELMDFSVAMHRVINDFNRDLLGFKLILRVGYNYGDVTAGVIGATKLYYDIWGDAVNIASRMDSTGIDGRIQLASNCLPVLSDHYEFEPRGQVKVKGKGKMNVFLLNGKKIFIPQTIANKTE